MIGVVVLASSLATWSHADPRRSHGAAAPSGSRLVLRDARAPAGTSPAGRTRVVRSTAATRLVRERVLARALVAELASGRQPPETLVVATRDGAGAMAVLDLSQHGVRLPETTVILAGLRGGALAETLGEVVRRVSGARAVEVAGRLPGTPGHAPDPGWRRGLAVLWAAVVQAGVPLSLLGMLLCMPLLALVVVVARLAVGVHTFGTFGPIIIALALLTTGLAWGIVSFVVIVGVGVWLRQLLQRLALQAVARVAVLVTLVSLMMSALVVGGALVGTPGIRHFGVFPMLVMAHLIESVSNAQLERGLGHALTTAAGTLGLAVVCQVAVDRLDLVSNVLVHPELLLASTLLTVVVGRWHGMRLVEYLRFWDAASAPGADDARPERLAS